MKKPEPWTITESVSIPGVYRVKRKDEQGRQVVIYDNQYSLTREQAAAIVVALNQLEQG